MIGEAHAKLLRSVSDFGLSSDSPTKQQKRYLWMDLRTRLPSALCFTITAQHLVDRGCVCKALSQRFWLLLNWDSQNLPSQFQNKKRSVKMDWWNRLKFTLWSTVTALHEVDRRSVCKAPLQSLRLNFKNSDPKSQPSQLQNNIQDTPRWIIEPG